MIRAIAALLVAACLAGAARAAPDRQDFPLIERGRYLAVLGDCQACHTAPGGAPFAGGLPVETPFGMVRSANITPDRETGIGAWTERQFARALRKGRGPHGEHLYPAMPYIYFSRVTDDDTRALFTYLSTVAPVHHAVATDALPFPFDIRAGMIGWNALYFHRRGFKPDPAKSAAWNRGAYLVEGLGHCAACHTPKTFLGGDRTASALAGYAVQGWFAPDLTDEAHRGLGAWSIDDVVAYLATGHNRFAAASGPMGQVVDDSTSHMRPDDLRAIASYLKESRAAEPAPPEPLAADDPRMRAGAAIYADLCSACHTPEGRGVPAMFPALAGSAAVQSIDPLSTIRVILRGTRSVATAAAPTAPAMPSFAGVLSDAEVAAVATFIRNDWGNAATAVSAATVRTQRHALARRVSD